MLGLAVTQCSSKPLVMKKRVDDNGSRRTVPQARFLRTRMQRMIKVAIVIGSTRPGRKADAVAKWTLDIAKKRTDADYELVDIKDFELPLLDEATPPSMGKYEKPHTKAWAAKVATYDAFVFVTPEYNHGTSGALKNALDFVYGEWNN